MVSITFERLLDKNGIERLISFSSQCVAREKLVGWYHTGPRLRASDQEINDLMKQFVPQPVMVIVDPRSRDTGIPTDAYFAVEEIKDVCSRLFSSGILRADSS